MNDRLLKRLAALEAANVPTQEELGRAKAERVRRLHAEAPACVRALSLCTTIISTANDPSGDVVEAIADAMPDSRFTAAMRAEILDMLAEYRSRPLAEREARHTRCQGGYLNQHFDACVAAFIAGEPEPDCEYVRTVGGRAADPVAVP